MFLWRAVDDEGEVMDMLVQKRRDMAAALNLLRKLLKNQGVHPETIVTDGLASYPAAVRELGCKDRHRAGGLQDNNRAENSHISIRRRERKQQRFNSQGSAQRFLATHAAICQIIDAISIRDRPAETEDRAIPGHWEGDLLSGAKNSQIATLVERTSRFVMLVRLDGKDSQTVVDPLVRKVRELPRGLMASLTWDRGLELAYHKKFTVATDVTVYFCDPQSPWQRGSNENTNGLLRQYFPKGTDLSTYNQDALNQVALNLNTRPRKTLGFLTPTDKLKNIVALTD